MKRLFIVTALLATTVTTIHSAHAASVRNPANGHYYALSSDLGLPNMTWVDAKAAANGLTYLGVEGHLVTITSLEEGLFVFETFGPLIQAWTGLFQASDGVEPGLDSQGAQGGWQWITGEPFYRSATNTAADVIFSNWAEGEPNNGAGEGCVHFNSGVTAKGATWNDLDCGGSNGVMAFLIEFDVPGDVLVCEGFGPPAQVTILLTPKTNRAIPLKLRLRQGTAGITDVNIPSGAAPVVDIAFVAGAGQPAVDVTDQLEPVGKSSDGNMFVYNPASGEWQLNLGTKPFSAAGRYIISARAGSSAYAINPTCEAQFVRAEK